jgi:hypothetical protein
MNERFYAGWGAESTLFVQQLKMDREEGIAIETDDFCKQREHALWREDSV